MKIVVLVNNSIVFDQRVRRTLSTLAEEGHDIIAVGVTHDRDKDDLQFPVQSNIRFIVADRKKRTRPIPWGWLSGALPNKIALLLKKSGLNSIAVNKFSISPSFFPLYNKAKIIKADLYYANDLETVPVAQALAKKHQAKYIYDAHEFYSAQDKHMLPHVVDAIEKIERDGIKSAYKTITVSESIADKLTAKYKCDRPTVVCNIPDLIKDMKSIEATDPVKIIYQSANLALHGRNLKLLIDAIALINFPVTFTLRGNCPNKKELEDYMSSVFQSNHQYNLYPMAPFEEMMEESNKHDIGLVPNAPDNINHALTLPNKIFEYMIAGLAIVSFNTYEVARIIQQENIGAVAMEINPKSLAAAILSIAGDRNKLNEIKKRARMLAETKYNWAEEKSKLIRTVVLN